MRNKNIATIILTLVIFSHSTQGQNCKVLGENTIIKFEGECTNGLANGNGRCYYRDSIFFVGKFENGLREGKGELHFPGNNQQDSIVKGYWSGDYFTGKRYEQYVFKDEKVLSDCEFSFISKKKKQLTIRIELTKSGTADESILSQTGQSFPRVVYLEVLDSKKTINQISKSEDPIKSEYVYEIESYPVKLKMELSNGKKIKFELNRSGEWLMQSYLFSKVEKRIESRIRN
jgi:MORN repeat